MTAKQKKKERVCGLSAHPFFHIIDYLCEIAPNLHFSMQAPHLMHFV